MQSEPSSYLQAAKAGASSVDVGKVFQTRNNQGQKLFLKQFVLVEIGWNPRQWSDLVLVRPEHPANLSGHAMVKHALKHKLKSVSPSLAPHFMSEVHWGNKQNQLGKQKSENKGYLSLKCHWRINISVSLFFHLQHRQPHCRGRSSMIWVSTISRRRGKKKDRMQNRRRKKNHSFVTDVKETLCVWKQTKQLEMIGVVCKGKSQRAPTL